MGRKIILELFILVVIFGIAWAIFYYFPIFPKDAKINFSIEQEEKLGKFLLDMVLKEQKEIHHPVTDSALKIIHQRLMSGLGTTEFEYDIRIIESSQINAFTLPGGNILIFSGLIEFSDSPEEVAAVLAHELGHVENRDVIDKLMKDLGIAILLSGLGGSDQILLEEISKTSLSTVFDRKQEKEADLFGLDLLVKSNISPSAFSAFFRKLSRESGGFNKNLEFLMTHPHNNSRIKTALEHKIPEGFKPVSFSEIDWAKVKEALKEENNQD